MVLDSRCVLALESRYADQPETGEPSADPAVSVVGPDDGEVIVLGTTRLRVLEDGSNTAHRLGLAESFLNSGRSARQLAQCGLEVPFTAFPEHRHQLLEYLTRDPILVVGDRLMWLPDALAKE